MIITICAACLLARIKHYRLRYIFNSWSIYPVLLTQCILVFFQASVLCGTYYFVRYAFFIETAVILSFLFSIFVYQIYKPAIIGACSIAFGTILNKFVMEQNGGKMPVYATLSYLTGYVTNGIFSTVDNIHVLGSEVTRFKFLTDFIDIGYSVLSLGDLFIHLFSFLMLYFTIKAANMRYGHLQDTVTTTM